MIPTLLINAVSSNAGGGLNDLVNTLPILQDTLAPDGWRIRVYVVEPGADALSGAGYPLEDVETVPVGSPIERAKWEYFRFPRIVSQATPDVVFHFSNLIFRKLEAPQLTVLRSPTFYNEEYAARSRSSPYLALRYFFGKRVAVDTVRWADEVFCISQAQRDDIIATVGDPGQRVQVSYLGLDVPEEAKKLCGQTRSVAMSSLSKRNRDKLTQARVQDRPTVLNVAHYYEHKNLRDLLKAMRIVRQRIPNALLVMTAGLTRFQGPWTDRTRADVEAAKALEQEGGLVDLGPVAKQEVWPLMAACDVFAFPSSLESFGHPLLEAMSMELRIVAADTRVHREIAGAVPLYHRVGDASHLAEQIESVLVDPEPQRDGLALARERAAEFSWSRHAEDLVRAILRLAGSQERNK